MKAFTALLLLAAAACRQSLTRRLTATASKTRKLQIKGCTSFIVRGSLQTEMLSWPTPTGVSP